MTDSESNDTGGRPAFLARIAAVVRRSLLDGARPLRASAGDVIFEALDPPRAGVVLAGRARRFIAAGDGRQVTTGYVRPGDLVGNGPLFGVGMLAVGAISDCVVAEFDGPLFTRLVRDDAGMMRSFGEATTALVREAHQGLALTAFGTMRERVAHHLLLLAVEEPSAVSPVVAVTQQTLADCVGTVREVVARALRDFRAEGLVAVGGGRIELLETARLARVAAGRWMRIAEPADPGTGTDLLDASPSAIIGVDSFGFIVYANASAARLLGWAVTDLVGGLIDRLVPASVHDRHDRAFADYFRDDGTERKPACGDDARAVRKDGTEVPITCRLAPTDTAFGRIVFATLTQRSASSP